MGTAAISDAGRDEASSAAPLYEALHGANKKCAPCMLVRLDQLRLLRREAPFAAGRIGLNKIAACMPVDG